MPIKKRFGKYVKPMPDGSVDIRTPVDCTRWDNEFRLRVVRDYLPPRTLLDRAVYLRRFDHRHVYAVQGKKVLFRQPIVELDDMPAKVLIARTEVIDVTRKKVMFLKHVEAAMRMLMVYSFLVERQIDGVALFDTYDWHQ